MMKIALIKEISGKNQHHLKILSIHNEEDLSHQKPRRKFRNSPLDGAQYQDISSAQKQTNKENEAKSTRT